ncbi:NRAMP family divalent metal transporter, partial [Staphylococcus hominis]|uniref:NRAMP family divalent metal transporter n=2 Tax=Bacillati TaxID=1783272 RepID=UPI003D05F598
MRILGPGITTGAADDDPSAIGTYAQAGATAGYGLLWTGLFTLPMMMSVQELAQRIALQTGVGLGAALRRKFPAWVVATAVALLAASNVIVIAADLQAVAAGIELLTHGFLRTSWLIAPVAAALVGFQLLGKYDTLVRTFKWLTLALFAYVGAAFLSHPQPLQVLSATFVPHIEFSSQFLLLLVAVLGTTLSPYLFFWQPAEEIDDQLTAGKLSVEERANVSQEQLQSARADTFIGMFFSQLVAYCIILSTAAVLHNHGKTDIKTAADAAQALTPFAGQIASVLFAAGFIGTGLLAIPVLSTSTAYAINEVSSIPASLAARPKRQPTFYAIIVLATAIGVGINVLNVNVIQALVIASVLSGVAAVPLLVLMTLFGADPHHMGARTSRRLSRTLTWISTAAMAAASIALLA